MSDFHKKSHAAHEQSFKNINQTAADSWFRTDNVDFWRHQRMKDFILPILKKYPNSKWVTLGDGRYGLDSIRIKRMANSISILPTDISPYLLEESKKQGYIKDFRVENAEALSFDNEEFDFAFMKEAFHHMPRPYLALYEMLRISKKGIILIEPNDIFPFRTTRKLVTKIKRFARAIMNRKTYHQDTWSYEEVGNYIYSISEREIEKVALGLNLPTVAFARLNDHYIEGVEYEKATSNSQLFKQLKKTIKIFDRKAKFGFTNYNVMVGIIFKEVPDEDLIRSLKEKGFKVTMLPRNPYLS